MDSYHQVSATNRTVDVLVEVQAERRNQDATYGVNRILPNGDWSLLVSEELGEVAKDLLGGHRDAARDELVQVAALVVAWIESIDNECADDGRPITYGKAI